jgi:hypothetical protein
MSIKVMSSIWDRFPAGGPDLLAMLCLADWCDDRGRCFPSIESISRKLRVSRSQAQRVVHRLILAGWVTVIGGHAGGAPGTTRRYQLNLCLLQEEASKRGGESATGSKNATRRKSARDGSQKCALTGSKSATQPVSEPSVNRQEETGAAAPALRRSRGGPRYSVTKEGIHYSAADPRDAAALIKIDAHPAPAVLDAVRAAKAQESQGRAFPSAVLQILSRQVTASAKGSGHDYLRRRLQEITREATVIDI